MRDQLLAWAIASRAGDGAESWLEALSDDRRERVRAAMQQPAKAEEPADPGLQLARARARELAEIEERASGRFGVAWREVNPAVKRFLWARIPGNRDEDT